MANLKLARLDLAQLDLARLGLAQPDGPEGLKSAQQPD